MDGYLKRKYPQGMPEPEARRLLCQIASAFQYLSSRGLSHRDLKPANILLTDWSNGKLPDAKLADFGFARQVDPSGMMQSKVGSPLYMAPEVLDQRPYSPTVDLWSTGIIFMQMLTATRPFPHARHESDILDFVRDPTRMPNLISTLKLSAEGKALLTGILMTDPQKRVTWESFLESDYVRPKVDLAASVVGGISNWLLRVVSFETAATYGLPVESNTPVTKFREHVYHLLKLSHPISELVLLSPRRGMLVDGHEMGEYYELRPNDVSASSSDRLACHAFSSSTFNGGSSIYEPKEASLKAPVRKTLEFEAVSSNVPISSQSADISTWELSEVLKHAQEMAQQLNASGKVEDWHPKLVGWKMAIEAHMAHANDLLTFGEKLKRLSLQMQSAKHRMQAMLAYTNHLRSYLASLIKGFERVQLVIKEVSGPMSRIPTGIPAMFEEARQIPLAPLPQAFPSLQIAQAANLSNLLDEKGMTTHLEFCVDLHRSMLAGELQISKSSDPEAATRYGLEGSLHYSGPVWIPTIMAASGTGDKTPPALISATAELNRQLGAYPYANALTTDGPLVDQACQSLSLAHQELNEAAKVGLASLATVLQRPASFVLTNDMLSSALPMITHIHELYTKLVGCVKHLVLKTDALISARQNFDRRCNEQWKGIAKFRAPFEDLQDKLESKWTAANLDFISAKSRSLEKLLFFPRDFYAMLAEIERRRVWVDSLQGSMHETNGAYENIIDEERQVRDNWWSVNQSSISRFREILPPNHEILNRMPEGYMRVTYGLQGITQYPKMNATKPPTASAASVVITAPSQLNTPQPQTSTEEEFYRMSNRALLAKVIELQRDNDLLRRQRQTFFQTGADEALRAENARLLDELNRR